MNDNTLNLLQTWHRRAYIAQTAHHGSAVRCSRAHYRLGVSAAVFSTVAGSALLAGFGSVRPVLFGLIGITSGILVALQTFLKYGERAKTYHDNAIAFGEIKKDIEQLMAFPPLQRDDLKTAVKEIAKRTNDTVSGSLSALPREWQKATAKAGKKEDCVFQAMQSGHVPFMMGSIESELVREIDSALDLKGGK